MLTAVAALVSPKLFAANAPYRSRPINEPQRVARIAAKNSTLNW
jgi:hypothetical protein